MKKTLPRDVEERTETMGLRVMREEKKRWERARALVSLAANRQVTFSEIIREKMNRWANGVLDKEASR